jgi:hypothetical protein
MYILCECAVCGGVTLVVATSLFGLCVVFLLLPEGARHLRLLVERTVTAARQLAFNSMVLQAVPARRTDYPSARNSSNIPR